jgi:prophage tail gpP-like protein
MSLSIERNGSDYQNFIRASVSKSIDNLTGAFSFISTADANNSFPIKLGDSVKIYTNGLLILTGFVEAISINHSYDSHSIRVSGRGKLADLIDSSVKDKKEFTGSISLQQIARTILDDLGLTDIEIENNAGTIEKFRDYELTSADIGHNAFSFLELFARKRQILLNETQEGNLSFSRGSSEEAPSQLVNDLTRNTNVKTATLNLDNTNRFHTYSVRSQLNPIYQQLNITPADLSDTKGTATDPVPDEIRSTRYLELNAEESHTSGDADQRAIWEANIRRSRSFNYTTTIAGHTVNGKPWKPNTLVHVIDSFCNIDAILLIRSVDYQYSLDEGSIIRLQCAPKDSYTLAAEQDQREASTTDTGNEFIF